MTLTSRNFNLAQIKSFYGVHHKKMNEDRPILSSAKCSPMILVSRNRSISLMGIFTGVPQAGGVKYNRCYAYVKALNKNTTCLFLMNGHCAFACCWSRSYMNNDIEYRPSSSQSKLLDVGVNIVTLISAVI